MTYDIFISYKRKSLAMANNLYYRLTVRGFSVFFDLEEMRNDRFDEQIYNYIRHAKDVIVVLEDGSLRACADGTYPDDWFCKELVFALREKKNIIPMLLGGCKMPSETELPEEMKEFAYKNALEFGSVTYFDDYLNKLETKGWLQSKPVDRNKDNSVFEFYSTEDCQIYEGNKLIGSLSGNSDEPFYYFVERKGKYRFKAVNSYTGVVAEKKMVEIDDNAKEIVDFDAWPEGEVVPPGEVVINSRPVSGETYTVNVGNFSFRLKRIKGGFMRLGATAEQAEEADANEFPPYEAHVKTFYMAEFPVTQNLFELVMGYNRSHFKEDRETFEEAVLPEPNKLLPGSVLMNPALTGGPIGVMASTVVFATALMIFKKTRKATEDSWALTCAGHLPVEMVSLEDARKFCRRLSRMTRLQFDLPTEVEWEYAARGGQKSHRFKYAGSHEIHQVAWYRKNGEQKTHPVGLKQPNELGLYDMSGNVWEWTKTPAHLEGIGEEDQPSDCYIRRGGSWWHEAANCRVSKRYVSRRTKRTSGLGFRLIVRDEVE